MRLSRRDKSECGASLVSALLLVAVMSSLAMALVTDLRFSMRRSANLEVRDQAYWYAMGAREFAEISIERAMQAPDDMLRPDADWLSGQRVFPINDGQLVGRVRDASNCFNLNSLVSIEANGLLVGDPLQQRRFDALLQAIGLPVQQSATITAELVDWLDSDQRPVISGAEDDSYARAGRHYRTGNTLLAEREELLALASMTPRLYSEIAPFVCAHPVVDNVPLNINTMQFDQAPLLVAMFEGELSRTTADALLIERPQTGFDAMQVFWELDAFETMEIESHRRQAVGRTSEYFQIEVDVLYAGARFRLSEMVEWRGGIRRLTQRYGSFS